MAIERGGGRGGREVRLRLVRQGPEEQAFEREFWADISREQRLACLWDMVLEAETWKGRSADELRLQRSVLRVERP